MSANPYETDLDPNPANYGSPHAGRLPRTKRRGVSRSHVDRARKPAPHLVADLGPVPPARLESRRAGDRPERYRLRHGPQRPRRLGSDPRRAHAGSGGQHHQHPARRGDGGVHPGARRGEGAHHRPGTFPDGPGCPRQARAAALRHRHRRPRRGGRRAAGGGRVRGVSRGRRPRVRVDAAERRVGRDFAQLHLRDHGKPEGSGLQPPRGVPQCDDQCGGLEHDPPPGVPLDPSHVPLQRLVLPLDPRGRRGYRGLPAPGGREVDLRRDCR